MEATGQDWANWIGRYQDSSSILHIIAVFTGRLDADRLRQAVQRTLALQPVLGCRFDETQEIACWVPLEDRFRSDWVTTENGREPEAAAKKFIEEEALEDGRLLRVHLIQSAAGDVLCIKLDHACCDGAGAKAYLQLLGRMYSMVPESSSAEFVPEGAGVSWQASPPLRSSGQVFAACGIKDFRQAYQADKNKQGTSSTFPFLPGTSGQVRCEWLTFPHALLRGRAGGITVNDCLVAAYMRVLARYSRAEEAEQQPGRQTIHVTVDLRRYLNPEETPVVCNLSGMEKVNACLDHNESFGASVQKVHEAMLQVKSANPGLHSAASMEFLAQISYSKAKAALLQASSQVKAAGVSAPLLSNMGMMTQQEPLCFGEAAANRAYAVTPAMHAPAFMLGASSYGAEITLTVSYFEHEHTGSQIAGFLAAMKKELTE
jgi:NRPS condensation-like uncharacterized protein